MEPSPERNIPLDSVIAASPKIGGTRSSSLDAVSSVHATASSSSCVRQLGRGLDSGRPPTRRGRGSPARHASPPRGGLSTGALSLRGRVS